MLQDFVEFLNYFLLFLQFLFVLSSVFGLPGNVASLFFPFVFALMGILQWKIFSEIVFIIAVGEFIEFGLSYFSGKFYGISGKSFWCSVAGAVIIGILMAPLFLGFGAVIGIFIGTFLGTFIYEYLTTNNLSISAKRGFLSLFSKITGTIIKLSLGLFTVFITFYQI